MFHLMHSWANLLFQLCSLNLKSMQSIMHVLKELQSILRGEAVLGHEKISRKIVTSQSPLLIYNQLVK